MQEKNKFKSNFKILMVANTSWYLFNFRSELISNLLHNGYDVSLAAKEDKYSDELKKKTFNLEKWYIDRASLNPINELFSIISLIKIYKKISPELAHNFTIKASIYGTLAAIFSNTNIVVNSITGLGPLFSSNKLEIKIIRFLLIPFMSIIFNNKKTYFIFQNKNDYKNFLYYRLTNPKQSTIIEGSGVNTEFFDPKKYNSKANNNFSYLKKMKFYKILFPSRIIKEKGFFELIKAVEILNKENFKVKLVVAGKVDQGNRSALTNEEFKNLKLNKEIIFLNHVKDMRSLYHSVDCVVLPSWREGLSKALLEASAMGKPIITTDVPGCKDVIQNGVNGLLVPLRDPEAIKNAIILLNEKPGLAIKLGKVAREIAIEKFQTKKVNQLTVNFYEMIYN